MTVKKIIEQEKGNYVEYEVWKYSDRTRRLHTDFIDNVDEVYSLDVYENIEALGYQLMDENNYEHTICANDSMKADFKTWYGNKDAKVLVIMLDYTVEL